jgi:Rho-associated protein kinase 1
MKGHEFVQISFHMPASCDCCTKPLWAPFRPPAALECKRCRAKFHKDHITPGNGDGVIPCKVNYDPTTAKEMLLMAASFEEQQLWVARLLKRIQKSGFKAATSAFDSSSSSSRVSPQESMRSLHKPPSALQHQTSHQKSSTLPGSSAALSSKK